jgi:two-component system OmpR family response regulator
MPSVSSPDRARILVVEDEPRLGELLRLYLERDGHVVSVVQDGGAALRSIEAAEAPDGGPIDLVVLDLMLPGLSGEAVLAAIRDRGDIPVLIASAKRSDLDRIAGLRMGADDYLTKPYNPNELTARVAAILRRARTDRPRPESARAVMAFDGGRLTLDPASRRFRLRAGAGTAVDDEGRLTPAECALLVELARHPGAVLTRDQLLEVVTRRPDDVVDRVVDVHVANVRRKVRDDPADPWLIETIPQTGYRLLASLDP